MFELLVFYLIVFAGLCVYVFWSEIKRLRCQRDNLYESHYGVKYETRFSETCLESDCARFRRQRDVLVDHIPDFLRNPDHDDLLLVLKEISEE